MYVIDLSCITLLATSVVHMTHLMLVVTIGRSLAVA